jgi:hypothetical protein
LRQLLFWFIKVIANIWDTIALIAACKMFNIVCLPAHPHKEDSVVLLKTYRALDQYAD